ncbi:MAG: hypothetical protein J6Y54_04175 [Lentisphaeria bacterium]|nr:hypothetical protein [Lentisphaeria bacterium]
MNKRIVILLILLAAAAIAAYFVLRPSDDLGHLKKTEEVAGNTGEAEKTVLDIVAAAESGDTRKALKDFMYVRDPTELERITAPLLEQPPFGEVEFLGCDRLVHSHSNNLTVHVYSAARQKSYAFHLVKDGNKGYKLSGLGFSKRKSRK